MFVRLLQAVYRLSQVGWLQPQQRHWVDTCVQTLAEVGKDAPRTELIGAGVEDRFGLWNIEE